MFQFKNKSILIISPEKWGDVRVSKHHYALELAKMGNKVYFLNPPFKYNPTQIIITKVKQNLWIIDYYPFIRGLNQLPLIFRKYFQYSFAKKLLKTIRTSIDLTWSFDPSSFQYLSAFGAKLNIFHPVDVHRSSFEREITKYTDLFLATSNRIIDRYKGVNKPMFKINHGLADYFLLPQHKNYDFIKRPNQTNVGYVGNLHYQFLDIPVLKDIITHNPNIDFYFIGPYEGSNIGNIKYNSKFVDWLNEMTNTYLIGTVPSEDLPTYLSKFDLFLMCYTGDRNITEMANPHKLLEFLSTGKVVVTHYIDEYKKQAQEGIICMTKNNCDLPELFSKVIRNLSVYNNSKIKHKRISIAINNTYEKQLNRIESIIKNKL